MFYSIPADQINLASQHPEGSTNGGGNIVTRRRRISYETRDLGLDELLNDEDFMRELSNMNQELPETIQDTNGTSHDDIDYMSILESLVFDGKEDGSAEDQD